MASNTANQSECAQLISSESGVTVKAMFNPKELSVEKSASWTPKEGQKVDEPPAEFGKPSPATLSVTLYFDTYEEGTDVYSSYVSSLEQLIRIMPDKMRPPFVIFNWGQFTFKGVLTQMNQKYTMFLRNGTRVRCQCDIKMLAASSAEAGSTGASSGGGGS